MTVELRRARSADADAVAEVLFASRGTFLPYLPSPRAEDEVRRWIADTVIPTQEVTVALADGRIVGFIGLDQHDGASWVASFYLQPGHTSQGIGARLLAQLLERARRPVRLWCFQQNAGARRFYERHGFKAVKFTDGRDNEERTPDVLYELA